MCSRRHRRRGGVRKTLDGLRFSAAIIKEASWCSANSQSTTSSGSTIPRLRAERLQRAKEQINKAGLGAIVTWDEANVRYLTGYYITTPNRPLEAQFAFCARNGEPHIIGGNDQEGLIKRMPWMGGRIHAPAGIAKIAAFTPDDAVVQNVVNQIFDFMVQYGVEKEPLGIDGTTLSYIYAEAFKKRGIEVVHAKPIMDHARMIKTADEIELMRITCANSEKAFAAIVDAIRPGIRECDLVGIGIKALYEEGDDHTEDLVCCSGHNTNPYGWSFTDKPLQVGDLVYIDVDGASYQGYKSCVYRTFCVRQGQPGAEGRLRRVPGHALRRHGHHQGRLHRLAAAGQVARFSQVLGPQHLGRGRSLRHRSRSGPHPARPALLQPHEPGGRRARADLQGGHGAWPSRPTRAARAASSACVWKRTSW